MEMKPKVKNPLFVNKSLNEIPIPKGNTAYSKAKRAEYVERFEAFKNLKYLIVLGILQRLKSTIKSQYDIMKDWTAL